MRICRETSLDIRFADHPLIWERGNCAFPCFRRGRVRAEPGRRVKGRVPCGFLGQRPKPSESLPDPIFASFQGSDRPFFRPWFFIDYLTLPKKSSCQLQKFRFTPQNEPRPEDVAHSITTARSPDRHPVLRREVHVVSLSDPVEVEEFVVLLQCAVGPQIVHGMRIVDADISIL